MNTFGLKKTEILRSKTKIKDLFSKGTSIKSSQLKLIFKKNPCEQVDNCQHMVMFSAPKKIFPKAVDRNKRKRHLREAYRLNKSLLYMEGEKRTHYYTIIFIYLSPVFLPFKELEKAMISVLKKIDEC